MGIPLIDLRALASGEDLQQLAEACEEWGFFQLAGHPVPAATEKEFFAAARAFFALPGSSKQALMRTETNPWGFYDRELTKNRRDWKEIFDFGIDQHDERFVSTSQWPDLPGFKQVMLEWFAHCEDIAARLLRAIAENLRVEPGLLEKNFTPAHSSFLRLNYYPPCADPADAGTLYPQRGHLGISHHTDAGAITVLCQDHVAGLQVQRENRWHTVEPISGSFIINVGDLVEVWSNGHYRAPLHRVLANPHQARYSAAFFYNPAFSATIQPATHDPPCFNPFNWGDFRALRAAGDYANLGEEVQISRYRRTPEQPAGHGPAETPAGP